MPRMMPITAIISSNPDQRHTVSLDQQMLHLLELMLQQNGPPPLFIPTRLHSFSYVLSRCLTRMFLAVISGRPLKNQRSIRPVRDPMWRELKRGHLSRELELLQMNDSLFTRGDFNIHNAAASSSLCTLLGHLFMYNTHLRELVLGEFLFSADSKARALLAAGIDRSKVETLVLKFSTGGNHGDYFKMMVSDVLITTRLPLTTLILKDERLGDREMTLLTHALSDYSSLKELDLTNCRLTIDQVKIMVVNWHHESPIQSLLLARNFIGPYAAQLLLKAARTHPALTTLDLTECPLGFKGLWLAGLELRNQPYLTHISMFRCAFWFNFCTGHERIVQYTAKDALVESLRDNYSIQELPVFLDNNCVQRDINFFLHRNTTYQNILRQIFTAEYNDVPSFVWCHVLAKFGTEWDYHANLIFYCLSKYPCLLAHAGNRKQSRLMAFIEKKTRIFERNVRCCFS